MTEPRVAPTLASLRARRDEILRIAASHGARNVHVFGSVARGAAVSGSDVDLLVDMSPDARGFAYFGTLDRLRRALSTALGARVDVVDRAALSRLRTHVLDEAVPL